MFARSSRFVSPLSIGLGLVTMSAFLHAQQASGAVLVDRIVAIVNESIITQSDMERFKAKMNGGVLTDDILVPDEETKSKILKNPDVLLQKMVDEKILDSEIKRLNLQVPIEKVEQQIRGIAARNNFSRDELKAKLQAEGINFSTYQDFIRTGLERQALLEKVVTSKIQISEDDVMAQLTSKDGQQVFEYTIAHIFFSTKRDGTKERAEFVLKKLKDGGNFEKLASEYSEDANMSAGGLLGTFKSGEFAKELEASVQRLQVGEFSSLVSSKAGIHILRLLKKRPIADPQLEKEKGEVRAQLFEQAYKKQFTSWLEQSRQEAFVRINEK